LAPSPHSVREPIKNDHYIPERLRREYLQILAAFNSGVWGPAAISCRVTLEGIVASLLSGDAEDNFLSKNFEPDMVLSKPIRHERSI
jgi:hypothetical protein